LARLTIGTLAKRVASNGEEPTWFRVLSEVVASTVEEDSSVDALALGIGSSWLVETMALIAFVEGVGRAKRLDNLVSRRPRRELLFGIDEVGIRSEGGSVGYTFGTIDWSEFKAGSKESRVGQGIRELVLL
jgi:hypothetical protein